MVEWRQQFDDLRQRRPGLAARVCRRLLRDLQKKKLVDLDALDELAAALNAGGKKAHDPNRPKPRKRYLEPEEITATMLLAEKRMLVQEGARLAEDPDTPLDVLRDKVHEFLNFAPGEAVAPPEDVEGTRAALVRRFLTDQLDFISVAKRYIRVLDFGKVLDHILPTESRYGRLGGKAAGLILANSILQEAKREGRLEADHKIPESYFLPSNGILEFIEHNELDELINVKYKTSFPPTIHKGLEEMLYQIGEVPLVIRSSSLLEDRIGHAFSGKYKSLFISNKGTLEMRLAALEDAIAEVYASLFHSDPIEYRRERGLIDFQEQMGILIQEVVGREAGGMLFPVFAGVAFSRCEMRWSPRIRHTDGMARLVLGLGTRAVDRTVADYPVLVALEQPALRAVQRPDEVYRYSQHDVDVIDLRESQFESLPLADYMRRVGRAIPNMNRIFSLYRDDQILPMVGILAQLDPDELVVTFDGLLKSPFPRELKTMLDLLEEGLGEPVDVEFAHDGDAFYMLQCRALSRGAMAQRVEVPLDVNEAHKVFTANRYVQMGQARDLEYVVLVDPRDYEELQTREEMLRVARAVGAVNKTLPERRFLMMGPGRWGSRGDIRLGVPVTYADICHTTILVEVARKKGSYLPDVSFGTHFFNDLVESGINYLPLYPDDSEVVWNDTFLNDSVNCLAEVAPDFADMEHVVRVIRVADAADGKLLQVVMDAEADRALAFLAEPQG
jgi:hypothetical protein